MLDAALDVLAERSADGVEVAPRSERTVLRVGGAFQQATDRHQHTGACRAEGRGCLNSLRKS
ncbi:hypothetical protein ACQPXT_34330 [Streptomyces sp. CA-100214]